MLSMDEIKQKKRAYLVNLSTTTKIVSFSFALGSSPTKFIEMSYHTCVGMSDGCNKSTVANVLALFH